MKVADLTNLESFRLAAGASGIQKEIQNVYICDLLSQVMGKAEANSAWITIQTHLNIIAVAALIELSCVIIPEGNALEQATAEKADEEGIPVICTDMTAYEVAKVLAGMLG